MKQTSWASQTQQASFEELGNMKAQMWYILTMDYYSSKKEKSREDNLPNSLFLGAQNAKGKKNEKFQNYEFTKTQSLMTSHRV